MIDEHSPRAEPPARESICTEDQLLRYLPERVEPLLAFDGTGPGAGCCWGPRAYRRIQDEAGRLEEFLDAHDARRNRAFALLTELVVSVRGFASQGLIVSRILGSGSRAARPPRGAALAAEFWAETQRSAEFIADSLATLLREVTAECERLRIGAPTHHGSPVEIGPLVQAKLPHDLTRTTVVDHRAHVVELGSKLLAHQTALERQSCGQRYADPEAMRRFVNEVADEEQCRFFETRIHNLVSRYDTYIRGTEAEAGDARLQDFRSYAGAILELLELMRLLVHFYQRHENDIRSEEAKDRIAALVDKARVLDRVLNYALYFVHGMMREAAPIARHLVEAYGEQQRVEIDLPPGMVLHVRPVSLITKIVAHHGTPVTMAIGDTRCYAGSVLQMLTTIGAHADQRRLAFEGDRAVLSDLRLLFEHGLGDHGSLPRELSYLVGGS